MKTNFLPIRLSVRQIRKAFTLIELLVVIAIIALLAAILFPVFNRARENARRSSCLSNMKQLGLGMTQYFQDYDEHIPLVGGSTLPSWRQVIFPYIKSTQVFLCPSRPIKSGTVSQADGAIDQYPAMPISYSANGFFENIANATNANGDSGLLAAINEPSRKLMVVENARNSAAYGAASWDTNATTCPAGVSDANWTDYFHTTPPSGTQSPNYFNGHLGTMNYLFVDGHVKALMPSATADPYNMWGATNHCSTDTTTFRNQTARFNSSKPDSAVSDGMGRLEALFN